jgi:hypothetical protein
MSTTVNNQFLAQPDWWITFGSLPLDAPPRFHDAKDCTLEADLEAVGLYHLVLGNGGIDSAHREIHVDCSTEATIKVVDVDNTHKDITFKTQAGLGVAPDQIAVSVRRLTSG